MQMNIVFMLSALITVATSTIQQHSFLSSGGAVGISFAEEYTTSEVRSMLHCAALSDQHSWCIAFSWDQSTKTCHEFNRTLTPEVTPHLTITSNEVLYIGHGYGHIAGMIMKFFSSGGKMTWSSAQNHCVQEGGRLVVLDRVEKHQAIQEAIKTYHYLYGQVLFVGATKIGGIWTLTTGQALDPAIHVQNDQSLTCLGYYHANLNDSGCTFQSYFICEK